MVYVHCVKLLLFSGAKTDIVNTQGYAPIHCAVIHEQYDILNLLLLMDFIDLNQPTTKGLSALQLATLKNHITLCKLLLCFPVDINQQANNGDTALHIACKCAYDELTLLLIEKKQKNTSKPE